MYLNNLVNNQQHKRRKYFLKDTNGQQFNKEKPAQTKQYQIWYYPNKVVK